MTSTEDIRRRVAVVIREALDDPALEVTDALQAGHVENWDSVVHIEIIYGLEDEFGVAFATDEVAAAADVGELVRQVERLLSGSNER